MSRAKPWLGAVLALSVLAVATALSQPLRAGQGTVHVAVAANFARTLTHLIARFTERSGYRVLPSAASTGQLYAQIVAGAPFDVLLSADAARPDALVQKELAVSTSRFVYARGRLVLWSPERGLIDPAGRVLERADSGVIAIADPRAAPYGTVAEQTLRARGLWDGLQRDGRISLGSSVTHAHQLVISGAARLGFVALSQVIDESHRPLAGSAWLLPETSALDQVAVLLTRARDNPAARALLDFLQRDPSARAIIEADGYTVP